MRRISAMAILAIALSITIPLASVAQDDRDTDGKIMKKGPTHDIKAPDSVISLMGEQVPEVVRRQVRMRDNSFRQEKVSLRNESGLTKVEPFIYVESPPSFYNSRVTDLFHDKDWVTQQAKRVLKGVPVLGEAKEGRNGEGRFVYLFAGEQPDAHDKCMVAMQLRNVAVTPAPGELYKDSVQFVYCASDMSEQDFLKVFDTVSIRKR